MQRLLLASTLLISSACWAQGPGERPLPFEFSAYSVGFPSASTENDGDVSQDNYGFNFSYRQPLNQQWLVRYQLDYEYSSFDFDRSRLFGGRLDSWDSKQQLGAGFSFVRPSRDGLTWFIAPRVQWAYADNASFSDGFGYGLLAAATYPVSDTLTLGFGGGYFNDPYDVSVIPVLLVKWQITDKLRLDNPFEPGFSGPGGLELSYAFNPFWEFGLGTAYRAQRFAVEQGSVEIENPLTFLRGTYSNPDNWRLSGYLGYRSDGKMKVHGQFEASQDLDAEAAFGAIFTYNF
ncbi:hypothetical protein [Ferrimonas sp. SCSIO 43195]|uniref:hypothetical protein n=1 Tax=Ferrimonas sp. SCSIO 43195 TaxID=2822844 RepID=UPI0020750BAA|nr:hypothetical protein [Ferrimonas sp. SCSIO 43195]USD37256.1 hypothetical protein J8Z22_20105 [Ferrimonas sp. SCSIO 43195]